MELVANLAGVLADDLLSGAVVLVVDDMPANVLLLDRLLRRAGVRDVVGVTDAREVLARFDATRPDLVLLDLHMPNLDGHSLLRALRARIGPDDFTPIVVLTADTTREAKTRALAAGAKDFLTKPFEQDEILLRVRNLLETRSLHATLHQHLDGLRAELDRAALAERDRAEARAAQVRRVQQVLAPGGLTMVFQPIVDLASMGPVGYEALARFAAPPRRPPDEWFAEAAEVGLGCELEVAAVRAAVGQLRRVPAGLYLSVNVSPATVLHPDLRSAVLPAASRLVLEITEHALVADYPSLVEQLTRLRAEGIRVAVDDAGAGYSGLRHILRLAPDIIKLDLDLTRGIDSDPARRALATSLTSFSAEIGATLTAEGIETGSELATLRRLGVGTGQGYHLGRPGPLPHP